MEILQSFVEYKSEGQEGTPQSKNEDNYVDTEQNILNIVALAISQNNKASMFLKRGEPQKAYQLCKK